MTVSCHLLAGPLAGKAQVAPPCGGSPLQYGRVRQEPLHFGGGKTVPPKEVTVKLPRQVAQQLDFLSQTLQLSVDEIATTAAYLVGKATDSTGLGDKRYLGLVKANDLEKTFRPTEGKEKRDLPDEEQFSLYSRSDLSKSAWTAWKNVYLKKLSPSRRFWQKAKETVSRKKSFTYRFPQIGKAGGSALFSLLGLLIPGAHVFLPFTLPPIRGDQGRIKRDLYNGVNMLCEAVKAKQADPSLALVFIQVGSDWRTSRVSIDVTAATGLFRKMSPGK